MLKAKTKKIIKKVAIGTVAAAAAVGAVVGGIKVKKGGIAALNPFKKA
jgi:hypothetical protein